jgi:hypothetical protein
MERNEDNGLLNWHKSHTVKGSDEIPLAGEKTSRSRSAKILDHRCSLYDNDTPPPSNSNYSSHSHLQTPPPLLRFENPAMHLDAIENCTERRTQPKPFQNCTACRALAWCRFHEVGPSPKRNQQKCSLFVSGPSPPITPPAVEVEIGGNAAVAVAGHCSPTSSMTHRASWLSLLPPPYLRKKHTKYD